MATKIALICNFSNEMVRHHLHLRKHTIFNFIAPLFGIQKKGYFDFGAWITVFASEFPEYPKYEFHIIAPHYGLKKDIMSFETAGVYYHFYKTDGSLLANFFDARLKLRIRDDFAKNRQRIKQILVGIKPKLVVVSGAENPYYSLSALDIENLPVLVLLQTVLNNPKSISYNVGSDYNRKTELRVLKKCTYFGCPGMMYYNCLKTINPNAIVFKQFFPIKTPPVLEKQTHEFDFVFYASVITKNKGIEDLVKAFAIVCRKYPNTTLNIIGRWPAGYKDKIETTIVSFGIKENIHYNEYFPKHLDVFRQIKKSRYVVVPGITALINSTVLEPMFMKMPVITYATTGTPYLNRKKQSVLLAENENFHDLADKMIYALENEAAMMQIAENGYQTVNTEFSPSEISGQLIKNIGYAIEHYYNGAEIDKNSLFSVDSFSPND